MTAKQQDNRAAVYTMHRSVPIGNRICNKRWESHVQQVHEKKKAEVRPSIDMSAPPTFQSARMRTNAKKDRMEEERCQEIDRHNRILLQRMYEVMNRPSRCFSSSPYRHSMPLHQPYRQREFARVMRDNQRILKRLAGASPVYDHTKWENDSRRQREYFRNACEKPDVLTSPRDGQERMRRGSSVAPNSSTWSSEGNLTSRSTYSMGNYHGHSAGNNGSCPPPRRRSLPELNSAPVSDDEDPTPLAGPAMERGRPQFRESPHEKAPKPEVALKFRFTKGASEPDAEEQHDDEAEKQRKTKDTESLAYVLPEAIERSPASFSPPTEVREWTHEREQVHSWCGYS
eukprot:GHVT01061615.1.p1 GENE.GHVT01061615.1~~GHVT01061615.1.p1  ORF type:complete len:343 (+),score=35.79 GHVT01061615.1:4254-5282(+)